MIALLDADSADKLAKLCGMFGSEYTWERAAAAAAADGLVREQGLTWFDVILPRGLRCELETVDDKLDLLQEHADELTDWEWQFVITVRGFHRKSTRQLEMIDALVSEVRDSKQARAA